MDQCSFEHFLHSSVNVHGTGASLGGNIISAANNSYHVHCEYDTPHGPKCTEFLSELDILGSKINFIHNSKIMDSSHDLSRSKGTL